MIRNTIRAGSNPWGMLSGALVCLSLAQTPALAQGDVVVSSDGERIAVKASSSAGSPGFAGNGRALRFGETDSALASNRSRETAEEFRKLLEAQPVSGPVHSGSIIGPDQRVRVNPTTTYPARATVLITFNVPGGSARCTGWMIWDDTVATAGHCVAKGNNTGFYPRSSYKIWPGRNGNAAPYGSCNAKRLYSNTIWVSQGRDDYDWAIIKLNCTIGNTTGWYGWFYQLATMVGQPVTVQGYPGDKPLTQWRATDRVRANQVRRVFYQADTLGGQSGAPVWRQHPTFGTAGMAIHAYGTYGSPPFSTNNHGTRITKQIHDAFLTVINAP